jgi:energy-coupling factor transporter ATP-binding protein EcfA2
MSAPLAGWAAISFVLTPREAADRIEALAARGLIEKLKRRGELLLRVTAQGKSEIERLRRVESDIHGKFDTSRHGPLYLDELVVSNYKCFADKQTLDLKDREGHPSRWTILLGENGVGKTTILQLIAGLFPTTKKSQNGPRITPILARYEWADALSSGPRNPRRDLLAEARFRTSEMTAANTRYFLSGAAQYSNNPLDRLLAEITAEADSTSFSLGERPYVIYHGNFDSLPLPPLIAAYGANRATGKAQLSSQDEEHSTESLFETHTPLKNPEEWLLRADYATRFKTSSTPLAVRALRRVKRALLELLPDVSNISVSPPDSKRDQPYVTFKTRYGKVGYQELSLGYQSTIAWIVDFASRLLDYYPSSPNPLREPAIVLIDEIDLHLHPKWQRSFMQHLEQVFLRTQFIATTHSPLIVQGSPHVNLALLKNAGDHVVIVNDVDEISGWRADQVLTSDLFGLKSARPDYNSRVIQRRIELMAKPKLSLKDRRELQQLDVELAKVPQAGNPLEDRAQELIMRAADQLRSRQGVK